VFVCVYKYALPCKSSRVEVSEAPEKARKEREREREEREREREKREITV
jgi:hypothetical protein